MQSKRVVLVALTGKQPIPSKGGLRLGFNGRAQVQDLAGGLAGSCEGHDGSVTAYIYPITQAGGRMTFENYQERSYVERAWTSAELAGDFYVLAYLLVFQLPGEPAPVVNDLSMKAAGHHTTLSAEVNGTLLSLEVPP